MCIQERGRTLLAILGTTRVVLVEAPRSGRDLERHRWDEQHADEHVRVQEVADAHDGDALDGQQHEDDHRDGAREPRVSLDAALENGLSRLGVSGSSLGHPVYLLLAPHLAPTTIMAHLSERRISTQCARASRKQFTQLTGRSRALACASSTRPLSKQSREIT